ncbi:Hypothetical predicted protein [Octopus vulgaris]|uniref:Uncharacterized protein n=1 Tax=Octopus vulgaris TaxID=6645 RepID=A0AA36BPQ0_OCTVU|nr:Hypothetical predicted protein [Octopus vulgaris]
MGNTKSCKAHNFQETMTNKYFLKWFFNHEQKFNMLLCLPQDKQCTSIINVLTYQYDNGKHKYHIANATFDSGKNKYHTSVKKSYNY